MSGELSPIYLTNDGLGARIECTDSSGAVRVTLVGLGDTVTVTNIGSFVGYIAVGGSTPTATTSHYPILPGTKEDQLVLDRNGASYTTEPVAAGCCSVGETTTLIVHVIQRSPS